ncbi:MAG: 23S rRNA (uracil(1939)-C(5))-methyltransferase RlmD [Pseudomonadota bacterium]
MGRRRRKSRLDTTPFQLDITSLAHDGRGVGRDAEGQVVFVDFCLPDEKVECVPVMRRKGQLFATTTSVLEASRDRVEPKCEVFGQCGGCVLQHLDEHKQIHYKQGQLAENFERIGKVTPERWLDPLISDSWGYRRRARLGAKYVPKKGGLIIGFRERNSSFIQPIDQCDVLMPEVSALLPALRTCLADISCNDKIPQIEVCVADNALVLVIRHLETLLQDDLNLLSEFGQAHNCHIYLQPGGLKTVHVHYPRNAEPLFYQFPDDGIRIEFLPTDFIQVNAQINDKLVRRAIDLLDLSKDDHLLDLFSGVGNFTLPLASRVAKAVGVEGDRGLVERAEHNKQLNKFDHVEFHFGDLFDAEMNSDSHGSWLDNQFDKILIDPPRSGAAEIIKRLPAFDAKKIVYVSCGPATLARDAGVMVNEHGYRLSAAGVIDMFPHTAHVESIALFER